MRRVVIRHEGKPPRIDRMSDAAYCMREHRPLVWVAAVLADCRRGESVLVIKSEEGVEQWIPVTVH